MGNISGLFSRRTLLAAALALSAPLSAQSGVSIVKIVGSRIKLVLLSDGRVVGWGINDNGTLGSAHFGPGTPGLVNVPMPGKVVDIDTDSYTAFAALENGTVVSWGVPWGVETVTPSPEYGVPRVIPGFHDVTHVTLGQGLNGLTSDGRVLVWREKSYRVMQPVFELSNVTGITQMSSSSGAVFALRNDGHVISWGTNRNGELGRAPWSDQQLLEPGEIPGLSDVATVLCANGATTVLKRDGTVWVWGSNKFAQFGNGQRTNPPSMTGGYELTPRPVPGISGVTAIAVGDNGRCTLALLRDGTLRGWGNSDLGQIGAGLKAGYHPTPVKPRLANVVKIWVAGNNTFAQTRDGALWVWGSKEISVTRWPLTLHTATPTRWDVDLNTK